MNGCASLLALYDRSLDEGALVACHGHHAPGELHRAGLGGDITWTDGDAMPPLDTDVVFGPKPECAIEAVSWPRGGSEAAVRAWVEAARPGYTIGPVDGGVERSSAIVVPRGERPS